MVGYFICTSPSLLFLSNHHIECLCCPFLFLSLPVVFVYHNHLYIPYADEVTRLKRLVDCLGPFRRPEFCASEKKRLVPTCAGKIIGMTRSSIGGFDINQ